MELELIRYPELHNNYKEIKYPKYLYPKVFEISNLIDNNGYVYAETYYPVRSKEGDLHFIQIATRKNEYSIKRPIEDLLKENTEELHYEVKKFMLINEFHNIPSKTIKLLYGNE